MISYTWRRLTTQFIGIALVSASSLLCWPALAQDSSSQRELYLQAREALVQRRTTELENLLPLLADYPLLPYLEYQQLQPRLQQLAASPQADTSAVDDFLQRHRNSWLGDRLEREWVAALAAQSRWSDVRRYHRLENSTTVLTCQALQAALKDGDSTALGSVDTLWNVGFSQPNECDPVFEAWLASDLLSPAVAWQRFSKLMQARQLNLARYVSRLMPQRERSMADLFLRIDNQPERVQNDAALLRNEPEVPEIILYGVRKLATVDAPRALDALNRYQDEHKFDAEQLLSARRLVTQRLQLQGFAAEAEALLLDDEELRSESLVGWVLRDALRAQDWTRVYNWLQRLPADAAQSERWRYWHARTLEQMDAGAQAESIYQELAGLRSFYGFLSADRLGMPYELVDRPVQVDDAEVMALYEIPSVARAYELYMTGDEVAARNEWSYATNRMTQEQIISSGKLADSWGWHRNGIQAMIRAGYWDDLQLRFPLAYTDLFASAADEYNVPLELLMSVARQESAFMHDVRSGAGALGLMQLMPATGRETAQTLGMRINNQDLLRPEVNIRLGSHYFQRLLKDFNGNRALAAAAYNAGPNRVRQWLRQSSENPLPLDIWIELIPFAETRTYVQNVLAFQVIYAYRRGQSHAFLTPEEADSQW
jgi:soluble lytic murein transglycosylase